MQRLCYLLIVSFLVLFYPSLIFAQSTGDNGYRSDGYDKNADGFEEYDKEAVDDRMRRQWEWENAERQRELIDRQAFAQRGKESIRDSVGRTHMYLGVGVGGDMGGPKSLGFEHYWTAYLGLEVVARYISDWYSITKFESESYGGDANILLKQPFGDGGSEFFISGGYGHYNTTKAEYYGILDHASATKDSGYGIFGMGLNFHSAGSFVSVRYKYYKSLDNPEIKVEWTTRDYDTTIWAWVTNHHEKVFKIEDFSTVEFVVGIRWH
ncbi:hypothetical protein RsTz2092_01240 [Deferribacterales bacterium RsTz2092]|nr:hypothetical protein AGMMS49941_02030 [Deferribacterales bacterium]